KVIAIELICASQAIYLIGCEEQLAPRTRQFLQTVRSYCPPLETDKAIGDEIELLAQYLLNSNDLLNIL
ncbi:MAG: histidine ammonia-lyase, partial [Lysinibacillus sp.]